MFASLMKHRRIYAKIITVQATPPSLVLIFGPFDPTGGSSLPADAVTCATLGCHALGALTATLVRDSAGTEDIVPTPPELLDDQARCLLEDMPVKAIKIGPVYTAETVSVVAQIAADYSSLPLVLQPGRIPSESLAEDIDTEDVQLALFELLLPQADLVVAHSSVLSWWANQGLLPGASAAQAAGVLFDHGAGWLLACDETLRPGQSGHSLLGAGDQARNWPSESLPARLLDAEGPIACAITAELAQGHAIPEAVERALARAAVLRERHFQPGMGQLLLDRSLPS